MLVLLHAVVPHHHHSEICTHERHHPVEVAAHSSEHEGCGLIFEFFAENNTVSHLVVATLEVYSAPAVEESKVVRVVDRDAPLVKSLLERWVPLRAPPVC